MDVCAGRPGKTESIYTVAAAAASMRPCGIGAHLQRDSRNPTDKTISCGLVEATLRHQLDDHGAVSDCAGRSNLVAEPHGFVRILFQG